MVLVGDNVSMALGSLKVVGKVVLANGASVPAIRIEEVTSEGDTVAVIGEAPGA